tara:strand:- start:6 stop:353 length:348 start_codon:yes stop_codon:yes gene_type:complete
MKFLIEAINFFTPNAVVSLSETKIVEWHDSRPQPTEEEIQNKIAELKAAEPMRLLREERNRLLSETDWWAVADRTMTSEQIAYRTALRDLPASSPNAALDEQGNLINVTWPTKPE